jgi:hypothetical protein
MPGSWANRMAMSAAVVGRLDQGDSVVSTVSGRCIRAG